MSLDSIIQIVISRQTTVVSRPGFGVPLLCGYHSVFPERVRTYTSLTGLTDDGFATTDPIYRMASALLSQSPKVSSFKVGRLANAATQVVNCTPTAKNSTKYTVDINGTPYEFTSDSSATVQEIVEGLTAAINAAAWAATTAYVLGDHVAKGGNVYVCRTAGTSGATGPTGTGTGITDGTCTWDYLGPEQPVTASEDDTKLTLTADVGGAMFVLSLSDDYDGQDLWARADATSDPDIAADLAAIKLEDNDWYGVLHESHSKAIQEAVATWVEANTKLCLVTTADTDVKGTGTSDIAYTLKNSARERTAVIFHDTPHSYPCAAWMGKVFPKDPGSVTWKFKTLSGISAMTLTATEITNLEAKNCNYYSALGGVNITQHGYTAKPEWIDIIRGIDWLHANMQADIYEILVNNDKVPYTQAGIALVEAAVHRRLEDGVDADLLRDDPAPEVTVPNVADISSSDKNTRHLPDVKFTAYLAGAIHSVKIEGVVSV